MIHCVVLIEEKQSVAEEEAAIEASDEVAGSGVGVDYVVHEAKVREIHCD